MDRMVLGRRRMIGAGCGILGAAVLPQRRARAATAAPVNIVMTQGVSGLVINEVAIAQRNFDAFGIAPSFLLVADGGKCVAALISGSAQICICSGFNQLTPALERGAAVKILAGALTLPSLAMYSGKPDIAKTADLKGKTIGIGAPGSVLHQMTILLLQKKGVDQSSVTFRNVGSNADVFKAVSAGTVDAGLSDVDVFGEQAKFKVHALSDGLLWKEIPEYTNQGSYAPDDAIRSDRDLLIRTLAAYAKTYRFVSSPASKETFIQAHLKVSGADTHDQAITAWSWIQDNQPYDLALTLSDQRIDEIQKLNVQFGIQKAVLPTAQITDMSLAREAIAKLH